MNAEAKPVSASAIDPPSNVFTKDEMRPAYIVLWTMSLAHFLNDLLQSLLSAIFPILKESYQLDFAQIGYIALAFHVTASLLQPAVGWYTDKRPKYYALAFGMGSTLIGLVLLAYASSYAGLLFAAAMVGTGSSIFHPEGSRVTRMAAGNRLGMAQSTFQVGGNIGQAAGPLLAAFVIVPLGQRGIVWFAALALLAILVLSAVGRWYQTHAAAVGQRLKREAKAAVSANFSRRKVSIAITLLLILLFSKSFYNASLNTFYSFYLIEKFGLSVRDAQLYLFLYMGAVAAGVYFGGPLGDWIGRKHVIWFSVFGALPFTLALPFADLYGAAALTVVIGLIMSASMSQVLVYALELTPGKVGTVSGLFFGFSFGMGGLGAAVLGHVADVTSLDFVFRLCAFLPVLGAVCWFLPDLRKKA